MNSVLFLVLICSGHAARKIARVKTLGPDAAATADAGSPASAAAMVEVGDATMLKPQPLVVNHAHVPLVVYLERGYLFNMQVIRPGEAVQLYTPTWGPKTLPYGLVAVVGDEASMPTHLDSLLNFIGILATPVAYIAGLASKASSSDAGLDKTSDKEAGLAAGLEAGLAVAAGALMSNISIGGHKVDPALIAEGAKRAADILVKKHPKAFMNKFRHIAPGTKYFEVVGGPKEDDSASDLEIREMSFVEYTGYNITTVKVCESLRSKGYVARASFTLDGSGDQRLHGDWRRIGFHSGRPRYGLITDDKAIIEWSAKRNAWRAFYDETLFGHGRTTLYHSDLNWGTIPESGWEADAAGLPVPNIELVTASEDEEADSASLPHSQDEEADSAGLPLPNIDMVTASEDKS